MKIKVKIVPCSSRDCIAGWLEDALKIKVKAAPEKGKANKAIIKLLEQELNLAKGSVDIANGSTSVRKVIAIKCDDETIIVKKLERICSKLISAV